MLTQREMDEIKIKAEVKIQQLLEDFYRAFYAPYDVIETIEEEENA